MIKLAQSIDPIKLSEINPFSATNGDPSIESFSFSNPPTMRHRNLMSMSGSPPGSNVQTAEMKTREKKQTAENMRMRMSHFVQSAQTDMKVHKTNEENPLKTLKTEEDD